MYWYSLNILTLNPVNTLARARSLGPRYTEEGLFSSRLVGQTSASESPMFGVGN
jgi:hypothetical protein